ncbi:glycoside hydrolase family 114 protein [Pleomassaria siparia CBS 279.74]|uniref:alpha-galactosidase n=1 Tax=Pleomassaria siparia CBS 279.74 TaxID=1314801 RepID=A0A6G1KA31_9PLEO|nr:glycoside hydrolase family 114 protein [Pleomassaria siparia CBS 279.74]
MHLPTAIAVAGSAGLAAAHPLNNLLSRAVAAFPAGSSWDILLNKGDSVSSVESVASQKVGAIDIDLFDTTKETMAELKSTMQVICYFSAGSKEGWRSDAGDFKAEDVGQGLDGWPDENWVNVKSDNVRAIMKKRIELAAVNGCTAIDPDNVDGFGDNQDGFGYDKSAYVDYIKFMADTAAANNLAIGLKNALDMIPDVVSFVQFAVNEQCHEYKECDRYKPFTDANKAVFNIEYGGNACDSPAGVKLSTLIKPEDQGLNTLGGTCASQGQVAQPAPSASASASTIAPSGPTATSTPIVAPALPSSTPSSAPQVPSPTSVAVKPTPTGSDEATPAETVDPEDADEDDDKDDDKDDDDKDDDKDDVKDDAEEDEDEVETKPWSSWHRPGQDASD